MLLFQRILRQMFYKSDENVNKRERNWQSRVKNVRFEWKIFLPYYE